MDKQSDAVNGNAIINIIQLDKQARKRVEDAKAETAKILEEAKNRKDTLMDDYRKRAEKRLKTTEEAFRAEAREKISSIQEEKNSKLLKLDKSMEENRERWKKEIFAAVTEGEED